MKNLFENKTDEELKMYFKQFQAWETLGVITDDELKEMSDTYIKQLSKLGIEWRMVFIIDLLKSIAFRWIRNGE